MSRRQASEAQREKGRQSAIARREILLEEQPENIIAAVRTWEMVAATKVEMSGSEKKTHEHVRHFLHKTCDSFWKFHVVVVQNNGKEMYEKRCAASAKLLFCLLDLSLFFSVLVALAA